MRIENNTLPYKKSSVHAVNYEEFYKYLKANTRGVFLAYVVNNNKIVFKEYLAVPMDRQKFDIATDKDLFNFLDSRKIKYEILKNKYEKESGRYFVKLKIFNKKDSCLNFITLSKYEIKSQIFYNADTLVNWRDTVSSKLGF